MDLSKLLDERCCRLGFRASSKDEALRKLAELAGRSETTGKISPDEIFRKLKEREEQGTTGFGDGIAIPHARISGLRDFLLYIVTSGHGVDFGALDHKKVRIFFIILAPEERIKDHVSILALVARALGKPRVRNELLAAHSKQVLYETFLMHTRESTASNGKTRQKLMVVILYLDEYFYDILEFLIEQGIEGATILESSGMGQFISGIPLFADFINFMREDKNLSKTLLFLAPEDRVTAIVEGIEDITGDMQNKQGAMIMALDVSFYRGSMKML